MARHRSPSGVSATLSGLTALAQPRKTPEIHPETEALTEPLTVTELRVSAPANPSPAGHRRRHGPAPRSLHRHPVAAIAATILAATIFAGSQPASVAASTQAVLASEDTASAVADRAVDAAVSRDERNAADSILAAPPALPGADEALVPDLGSSGSANGPTGTAALTGNPCPTEGFGGVQPHVAQAGWHLIIVFGLSESDVGGVASRPGNPNSDHPRGLALDFMVDTSTGNALSAYAEEHSDELGINYILWQVPDHYDHVHISFNEGPGSGMTC